MLRLKESAVGQPNANTRTARLCCVYGNSFLALEQQQQCMGQHIHAYHTSFASNFAAGAKKYICLPSGTSKTTPFVLMKLLLTKMISSKLSSTRTTYSSSTVGHRRGATASIRRAGGQAV